MMLYCTKLSGIQFYAVINNADFNNTVILND